MNMRILYSETVRGEKYHHRSMEALDYVSIVTRKWTGGESCDVVTERRAMIDGDLVVNERECVNGFGHTDAEIIRATIARFDKMLDSHPTLDRGE